MSRSNSNAVSHCDLISAYKLAVQTAGNTFRVHMRADYT
jgi:hypothetical protein